MSPRLLASYGYLEGRASERPTLHGSADGWSAYRDVEDGTPFVAKGPVTCLTVIGKDKFNY